MHNNIDLFTAALQIEDAWYIEKVNFDMTKGELHIHMNFKRGGFFAYKKCCKTNIKAYDTTEKTWQHLNFFQYKAFIHCRTPRTDCLEDGPLQVEVPWAREGSGFTLLFEAG